MTEYELIKKKVDTMANLKGEHSYTNYLKNSEIKALANAGVYSIEEILRADFSRDSQTKIWAEMSEETAKLVIRLQTSLIAKRFNVRACYVELLKDICGGNCTLVDLYLFNIDMHNIEKNVNNALNSLDENSRYILSERYGLNGVKKTKAKLAEELGISSTTLHMKERKALLRLRHPSVMRLLMAEDYFNKIKYTEQDILIANQSNLFNIHIKELDIPVKVYHSLLQAGIVNVGEFLVISIERLLSIDGIGVIGAYEVVKKQWEIENLLSIVPHFNGYQEVGRLLEEVKKLKGSI